MRKCKYKKYCEGKGIIEKFGYFHQFGITINANPSQANELHSVAIIEDRNGKIDEVCGSIQFLPDDFNCPDFDEHMILFGF